MPTTSHQMPTVGEIARRLGEPVHRVEYVIRSRRIRPSGIAGNARVFSEEDVRLIEQELRQISDAKTGGTPCSRDSVEPGAQEEVS